MVFFMQKIRIQPDKENIDPNTNYKKTILRTCVIAGCHNSTASGLVALKKFPTDENLRRVWMEKCNISVFTSKCRICEVIMVIYISLTMQ